MQKEICIGNRMIGEGHPAYIIAEMSANHAGSIDRAVEIIHAAKKAGADCIKIQTYTPDTLTIDCHNEYFQVKNGTWEGENLYSLYGKAYTPWEWQGRLKEEADKVGIDFLSTPFDTTSVDFLEKLGLEFYKIASFEMIDLPLIRYIASTGKPIIMSTGMATREEIREAIHAVEETGNHQLVILKCSSAYPAKVEEMNLSTISDMKEQFGVPIGLSDHSMGHMSAVTAVALGANVIEKHFCISREIENPDASFSMTGEEFSEMVLQIRETEKALGIPTYGVAKQEETSVVFRRSIFTIADISEGEKFTEKNVRIIRPGYGIKPKYWDDILTMNACCNMERGKPVLFDCVQKNAILFLTNNHNTDNLISKLRSIGETVYRFENKLNLDIIKDINPKSVISFNYRFMIPDDVIRYMDGNIINLHTSYLPYNRGSSPNFFSFYDNTPKGVTIHKLTAGLDTGPILFQEQLSFDEEQETFASSYQKLIDAITDLCFTHWIEIINNQVTPVEQQGSGTYHKMQELNQLRNEVPFDWNEKIADVLRKLQKYVFIRTDANEEIGAGHLMRCLSIADAMSGIQKITPVFITSDNKSTDTITTRGFLSVCLGFDYKDKIKEINSLKDIINKYQPLLMIVDSYQVSEEYFEELFQIAHSNTSDMKLYYLDDIEAPAYQVDGFINYNIYAEKLSYNPQTKNLLGTSFVPLKACYQNIKFRINNEVKHVLITSGASDQFDICHAIAEQLVPDYPEIVFHVVSGAYAVNRKKLIEMELQYSNLIVEQNVRDMQNLESMCDIAISAAGSTMYELAAIGIPTIMFYYVDNQKLIAETFAKKTGIVNAGNYLMDPQKVCFVIKETFQSFLCHVEERDRLSKQLLQITDGYGAIRLANALFDEVEK